jgi:hypothetical protein
MSDEGMRDMADAAREQGVKFASASIEKTRLEIEAAEAMEERVAWDHYVIAAMEFISADHLLDGILEAEQASIRFANRVLQARRETFNPLKK